MIQALNEEYWLPYAVKELAAAVDQVFIIEGAVLGRNDCDVDGHSTDNTIEIIDQLAKKYSNVKFVTRDERWKDLEDMKNFLINLVPPDNWVVINDADEMYKLSDLKFIREHSEANPQVVEYLPLFLHFYRDFYHVLRPGGGADPVNITHQRIILREEGDYYRYHPTIMNKWGRDKFFFPPLWPRRIFVKNMFIYHFGYIKGAENYLEKHRWYSENLVDFQNMSQAKIDEIMNHPYVTGKDNPDDVLFYSGDYPEAAMNHPQSTYKDPSFEEPTYRDWKSVKEYDGAIVWPWHQLWRDSDGKSSDGNSYIQPP